jgi:hypothetical protein
VRVLLDSATTITVRVSMATCRDDCHYGMGMYTGS